MIDAEVFHLVANFIKIAKKFGMDLSLDEIIKNNQIGVNDNTESINKRKKSFQSLSKNAKNVVDARNKIIQKNRAKIRDAREKLVQIAKSNGDARLKLQRRRYEITPKINQKLNKNREFFKKKQNYNYSTKLPKLIEVPRGYIDYDNMEIDEEYESSTAVALRRTVYNDIPLYNPYTVDRKPNAMWNNDPFDCYEVAVNRPPDVSEPVHLRRQIRNVSPDIPPKSILRSNRQLSPSFVTRCYIPEESSHLSYEMRTRLERAPDPHASMGIFSNPLKPLPSSTSSSSSTGYRIVVSNLHSSVTQGDIKELFEDIGELHEARLVRPGVAEVIFKTLKDAEKAVDTYHNRQLDGQPMKCLLVNPRASNKPTAPAIKTSSTGNYISSVSKSSNKTPLEIDIDALHKVLFRRH